jgi:hypothetical protein
MVGISQYLLKFTGSLVCKSELYKNINLKAEEYETLVKKLKEINQSADRAKHAEALIENHFRH